MALNPSTATKNAALGGTGLKSQFDLGFLYLYSGAVPATADAPLDMGTEHTEVLKVSSGGTGLTFDVPTAGVLAKAAAETWDGPVAFDGFEAGQTTLTPTFYRFCAAGDDGRGAANASTGYRVQGTVGGPSSSADLVLGTPDLTSGNTQPVGTFRWSLEG